MSKQKGSQPTKKKSIEDLVHESVKKTSREFEPELRLIIEREVNRRFNEALESKLVKILEALLSSASSYKSLVGRQDGWIARIDLLQTQQTSIEEVIKTMQKLIDTLETQTKMMGSFIKKIQNYAPDYVK